MFNIPLLMGTPAGGAEGTPQGSMVQIAMIAAVFAVFWLLIIRPQRKKQKETKNMLSALKKGDRVTSIGGIRGTVKSVTDAAVVLEVDNKGATLEFSKSAIGSVDSRDANPAASAKKTNAAIEEAEEPSSDKQ